MKQSILAWLNALPIAKKINYIFIPPTIALTIFVVYALVAADTHIDEAKSAKQTVDLAFILDKIAHNHAVERGITAGFLASDGTRAADKLADQRIKAGLARSEFLAYYESPKLKKLPESVQTTLDALKAQLDTVPDLQSKVDKLDLSAKPFMVYSSINKLALDSISYLVSDISNPDVSKQLNTMLALLWLKERSGQERGALNGVFVKRAFDLKKFGDINFYIQDQNSKTDAIMQNVSQNEFDQIVVTIEDESHSQVKAMRDAFMDAVFNGTSLNVDPQFWFQESTKRIGNIKKLADLKAKDVTSVSNSNLISARGWFWATLLITVVLMLVIIFVSHTVSSLLRKNISALINGLHTVRTTSDFSNRVKVDSRDELGNAAEKFNELMGQLNITIDSVNQVMVAVSKGQFDVRVNEQLDGDLAKLKTGVNDSASKVSETMEALENVMVALENGDFSARMSKNVEGKFKDKVDYSMKSMEKSMREVSTVMKKMSEGDFSVRVDSHLKGSLNELKQGVNTSIDNLVSVFNDISESAIQQKAGNFSWQIQKTYQGEIGQLTRTINESMRSMSCAVQEIIIIFSDLKSGLYGKRIQSPMNGDLALMKKHMNETMESLENAIAEIVGVAQCQAKGDLSGQISGDYRGELSVLKNALNDSGRALKTAFDEMASVMQSMRYGDFSNRIEMEMPGAFGEIKSTMNNTLDQLDKSIEDISNIADSQKAGKLSQRMDSNYDGALETISNSINQSMGNLSDIVKDIKVSASSVKDMANEQFVAIDQMAERTEKQASSLEEIASTMEEMSSLLGNTEGDSKKVAEDLAATDEAANSAMETVSETVSSMNKMKQSSSDIANFTGMIDEIAFQTNLLALNAAVEAARAGEQGRGFAVVASEVRTLAQRSSEAAKQIKDLIDENAIRVDGSFDLAEQSQENLKGIVKTLSEVRNRASNISNASREQAAGIREINSSISYLDGMTQKNVAMVEEIKVSTSSLTEQSVNVDKKLGYFDI